MRQGKDARRDHQMRTRTRLLALALAAPLVFAACSGDDNNSQAQQTNAGQATNMTIAVVTHGAAGDAFWDVVKNGAEAAGKQYGIKVNYNGNGDPAQQSQLIDAAVSQKVNGIVVSMANPDALKESIQKAVQAGIPVITINSGQDRSKEFGAITHVGQSEDIAGQGAGEKLEEAGVTKLLCGVHERGHRGVEVRRD